MVQFTSTSQQWLRILSVMIPLLFGSVICATILNNQRRPANILLIISLSPCIGLVITSVIYFYWMIIYQPAYSISLYTIVEGSLLIFAFLLCGLLWRRNQKKVLCTDQKEINQKFKFNIFTAISVFAAIILFLSFITFINNWQKSTYDLPNGNWDGWAIWNLRARFIDSGVQWRDGFTSALAWSHPDYPLLLPSSIAREWVMLGNRTQVAPILINLVFTLSILALMLSGLALTKGWKTAIFAGLFTLPVLQVSLGFKQYADMLVAFFFLASNYLLFLADWSRRENSSMLILVGLTTGAALWAKNEGWAFLLALGFSEVVRILLDNFRFRDLIKRWLFFSIGLAPVLVTALIFKFFVATPNDLVQGLQNQNNFSMLFDYSRYLLIAKMCFIQIFSYGSLRIALIPLILIFMLMVGVSIKRNERNAIIAIGVRILIISWIYFGIYLFTPYPLEWHLDTSLNRLITQLLPSFILLVFLSARSIEEHEEYFLTGKAS